MKLLILSFLLFPIAFLNSNLRESNNEIINPVNNPIITQGYSKKHPAYDIIDKYKNLNVYSIEDCVIIEKGLTKLNTPYILCYTNNVYIKYMHIDSYLKINTFIRKGDLIGNYNSKGNASGKHVHIAILNKKNKYIERKFE